MKQKNTTVKRSVYHTNCKSCGASDGVLVDSVSNKAKCFNCGKEYKIKEK